MNQRITQYLSLAAVLAVITLNLTSAPAAEPRVLNYRNGGTGAFPDADPPLDWSNARNVEWSWEAPAFDMANSSPIIVDDPANRVAGKVFTLIAPHGLVCLDKVTGKELWRRESHAADSQTNALAAEQSLKMLNRLRLLRLMVIRPWESWTETHVQKNLKTYHAELDRLGPNAPPSFKLWMATLDRLAADAKQNEEKYKAEIKQLEESLPAEVYPGSKLKTDKKGAGWVCAAPPASDGKRVFAIFHPGLVVCYDLDGNRQWVHLMSTPEGRAPGLSWGVGAQAPVPVDGKLLVQQGDELQCLDAATGKVLWRRYHRETGAAAGPVVGRGGDGDYYYATPMHGIGRVSDGEIVFTGPRIGGYFPMTVSPAGDVFHYVECAVRLPKEKGGKVEVVWTLPDEYTRADGNQSTLTHGTSSFCPTVCNGDLLFWQGTAGAYLNKARQTSTLAVFDAFTGKLLREPNLEDNVRYMPYPPIILGGKYLYVTENGGTTHVFTADREFRKVAKNTVGIGYAPPGQGPLLTLSLGEGQPITFGNMGPVFEGKRMYFRTMTHLYCITRAVEGTFKDDPKVVAAIRAAKSAEEAAKYLENDSAQYRYEAVKRLSVISKQSSVNSEQSSVGERGKLVTDNGSLITSLQTLAKADLYQEIRAEALQALGLEPGKPGFEILRELMRKHFRFHSEGWELVGSDSSTAMTLKVLGKDADPALIAFLTDDDSNQRCIGAAAAGQWPSGGTDVRDALITLATDRSVPQPLKTYPIAAIMALRNWPVDAKVTELLVKLVHDEKEKAFHPPAMVYLMRALPDDQKNPVLAAACKAGGTDHVWDLVGREALDTIKSVVTTTRDLTQAGIVETLCFATAMTGKPSLRAFAGEMGQRALQQPSADAQALDKIVKGLKKVGADAAPALPALKALKVEDANTAKAIADAIAEIEAKVAAVKEIKK